MEHINKSVMATNCIRSGSVYLSVLLLTNCANAPLMWQSLDGGIAPTEQISAAQVACRYDDYMESIESLEESIAYFRHTSPSISHELGELRNQNKVRELTTELEVCMADRGLALLPVRNR